MGSEALSPTPSGERAATNRLSAALAGLLIAASALAPLAGASFNPTEGADAYGHFTYDGTQEGAYLFGLQPEGDGPMAVTMGDAGTHEFQISNLTPGVYDFSALLDVNGDNQPTEGEPMGFLVDLEGNPLAEQVVDLSHGDATDLNVRFFDEPPMPPGNETSPPPGNETSPPENETSPPPGNETSPPGNETSPPPEGESFPACDAGAYSVSGHVRVELESFDATLVKVLAAIESGEDVLCATPSVDVPGTMEDFTGTGAPYVLPDLGAADYTIIAWVDLDDNGIWNMGEPESEDGATGPLNGSLEGFDLVVVPDMGEPGDDSPPSLGGNLSAAGEILWDGALGTATIRFHTEAGAAGTEADAPGTYALSGLVAGEYVLEAWIETDGQGGPGATEPRGDWIDADGTPIDLLLLDANTTGLRIAFQAAPEGGWSMEPGPGEPGTGGSGGGCSGDNGATVQGYVTAMGDPVMEAFVRLQAADNSYGEFTSTDAEGYFTCSLVAGSYGIEVNHPDMGFAFDEFTLVEGETVWLNASLSFDARPPYRAPTTFYGGTLWGNLTVADAGVEGVRVNVFRAWDPNSPNDMCQPADPTRNTLSTCGGEGQTDANGTFVITHLGDGTYDLYIDGAPANLPSRFESGVATISGATNETTSVVDLGTFAFESPAYIRGLVTRASDGQPAVGVDVNAWPMCEPDAPCGGGGFAQTDENGEYQIVASPGEYGMVVQTGWLYDGPPLSSVRVDCGPFPGSQCLTLAEGATVWQNFSMEAGAVISGHVQDAEGAPVRAFIQAESFQGMDQPPRFAWGQTDWDGSGWFNLTLEPGVWRIRVEPDRFERPDLGVTTFEDVEVGEAGTTWLNATLAAGATLRGVVVDDAGAPVRNVNVFANVHVDGPTMGPGGFGGYGFTDENGQFSIAGLPEGVYDLEVDPGWGSAYMRTRASSISIGSGATVWQNMTLSSGGTLAGYVLDGDGQPIARAMVDAFWQPEMVPGQPGPAPGDFPESGAWGHAETDENGYYAIRGLTDGTFGMSVRPPFGTSYTSAHLDAFRDALPEVIVGATTHQNFTLSAGGSAEGCVVESDGATPVRFAWVNAFSPQGGFGGGEPTQSDGCFTLRGLSPGTYEIEVHPPFGSDYGRTRVSAVTILEGETTAVGEIVMSEGVRLAGRVIGPDGPLQGVFVNAFQIQEGGPGAGPGAYGFGVTDAEGVYNLSGLVAGKYGMHIQPPMGSGVSAKFVQDLQVPETGRYGYDIVLGGGGWIEGRVLVGDEPLANAWVGSWSFQGGSGGGTMTDDDGRFNLSGLSPANDYNLDVFPPPDRRDLAGEHRFPLTVAEGQGTDLGELSLATGGTLTGRVLDASGDEVAYAFINVGGNNTFGWGMTDSEGEFSVTGLRASEGDVMEIFVQPGPGAAFVPTRVSHTWAPDGEGESDAGDIELDAGKTLRGFVSRDGVGVADVEVFVMPSLPYHGPPIGGSATTSAGGWFNITGLPAGDWDVRVQPADGSAGMFEERAVSLADADEVGWHNVTLSAGSGVTLGIDDGAAPIEGARADCFSPELRAGRGGTTDASGAVTFTGLPAGTYQCRVFAEGFLPLAQNVTLVADETAEATFSLTAATLSTLTGTFTTTNASGAEGYLVVAVPSDGVQDDDVTGFNVTASDGSFVIAGLPPGEYDLDILTSAGEVVASAEGILVDEPTEDIGAVADQREG